MKEIKYALDNAKDFEPDLNEIQLMGVDMFFKKDKVETIPLIKNFLDSQTITLIGGDTGVGKSWLGLQMALCLASGKDFMNHFKTELQKVIYAQFEMTDYQVEKRMKLLFKHFDEQQMESIRNNLFIMQKGNAFEDQWKRIRNIINDKSLEGSVLIVDNLYTSLPTSLDIIKNADAMTAMKTIDQLQRDFALSVSLLCHHTKGVAQTGISKDDILGCATLSRFASNIFQMKKSVLSNEYKIGKLTKVRDEDCELEEVPIKLKFQDGYFTMSQIITNEVVHYQGLEERWEIKIVREIWDRKNLEEWDRAYLRKFLQAEGWKADRDLETKITRLINKWNAWGLLKKDYNRFSLKQSELFENVASL